MGLEVQAGTDIPLKLGSWTRGAGPPASGWSPSSTRRAVSTCSRYGDTVHAALARVGTVLC
jgi:hypothetical protein